MERKRAVAVIVENSGKILMVKKRSDPNATLSGEWHLPGETIEGQEKDEESIKRGLQEEAGIEEVEVIGFIASYQTPKGMLVNWYLCQSDNENLIPGSDAVDACWVAIEEVQNLSGEIAKSLWPSKVRKFLGVREHGKN